MAREYGPFRERFEEYILERTANHPSLVPMTMDGQGKARFRLACKDTLNGTSWSSWISPPLLKFAPQRVLRSGGGQRILIHP